MNTKAIIITMILVGTGFYGCSGEPVSSVSVEVSVGGLIVADRNVDAQQDGVAYNYTNATCHSDHKNSAFKGGYYT